MLRPAVILSALFVTACAGVATSSAPLAERTAALSLHDFMKQTIDPAATKVFDAGNAEDVSNLSAAQWKAALEAAAVIQESGRILLLPPRAHADPEWSRTAHLMIDAGVDAANAAAARNLEGAFEAGGKLYESCNGCHSKFVHGKT